MWVMVITVVLYLGWMFQIGLKTKNWVKDMGDFLVAGREISFITLSLGLFSIIAAGTTYSGATGLGYSNGMSGAIWGLSWALAALIAGVFFAPLIRATGGYTLAEWLGMNYGLKSQVVIAIPQIIGSICSGAAQIIGSAFILCGLTGMSYLTAVLVSGIIVLVYTYMGGLWAVAYTEVIQGVFCILAIIITLGYLMLTHGGLPFLAANLPETFFSYPGKLGWGPPQGNWGLLTAVGCFYGYIMIVIPNTYIWTKTASSRSSKTASWSFWFAALLCVLFLTWPIAMIGMYGKAMGLQLSNPQMVFGAVIKTLPIGLDSIVLVGILSAIMSTASGAAMGAGASAVRDLYQAPFRPSSSAKDLIVPSKIITFICWVAIIVLAIAFEKVGTLQMLGLAFAYYSVTFPVFVASFYFRNVTKEASFWSCLIATIITTAYVISMKWQQPPYFIHPIWIGSGTSLLLLSIITILTKGRNKEKDIKAVDEKDYNAILDQITKGRNQMVYLIDFIGKEGKYTQNVVNKLVSDGLVNRKGKSGLAYQIYYATEEGMKRYKFESDHEKELIKKYGISFNDYKLIQKISDLTADKKNNITFEDVDALKSIEADTNISISSLKNHILFLQSKGFLEVKGIMRMNFKLNSNARNLLNEAI